MRIFEFEDKKTADNEVRLYLNLRTTNSPQSKLWEFFDLRNLTKIKRKILYHEIMKNHAKDKNHLSVEILTSFVNFFFYYCRVKKLPMPS
jgi:hypothetical protein